MMYTKGRRCAEVESGDGDGDGCHCGSEGKRNVWRSRLPTKAGTTDRFSPFPSGPDLSEI